MSDIDRCICCGEYVPEGTQFCSACATGEGVRYERIMRNFERYTSPEELFAAHVGYCKANGKSCDFDCRKCEGNLGDGRIPCLLAFAYSNCI